MTDSSNLKTTTSTLSDSAVFHRDNCRLCGSRDIKLVMHLEPTPVADAYFPINDGKKRQDCYPLDLCLCQDCGLVHLSDVVDPEILYGNYIYETTTSLGLVEHFRQYAQSVLSKLKPKENSFFIEIGSNDGTLLRFFQEKGMKVLGIDPAREIAKKTTEGGVETLTAFFSKELAERIKVEKGWADIIIANNVVANIDDLDDLLIGIKSLLKDDGIFIFESGYLVDTIEKKVFDNIYHEHISYLSVKPMKKFFEKHGMEFFSVDRVSTKGGSIRGYVQLKRGHHQADHSVNDLIDLETNMGIYTTEKYEGLTQELNTEKEKLLNFLHEQKNKGCTIAGYGASHSVTTFMYYFGLDQWYLDFLVDDNAIKFDTFSPGFHVPVYPSAVIYEKKPDYIIVLAWRFFKPIINKHQAFVDGGGKFVVPLPKFEIR